MVEGLTELVAASGISVPARAKFVGRFMAYTTFGAVTFGLVCGQLSVMLAVGPLIPFMWGAWTGFTLMSVGFWRHERSIIKDYVGRYPVLMEQVIRTQFPYSNMPKQLSAEQWLQQGSLSAISWCILAAQTAAPLIQEHEDSKLRSILEAELESS
ncbi:unnamed protein product [Symbiodinium natans]|uniref:Uncharacterized protein n=1 Tax=Symbiodinium natans TaxID=878477 RepID=A0A812NYI8_9DINO|nr:unnamed protein product [Symbiodinium natans]